MNNISGQIWRMHVFQIRATSLTIDRCVMFCFPRELYPSTKKNANKKKHTFRCNTMMRFQPLNTIHEEFLKFERFEGILLLRCELVCSTSIATFRQQTVLRSLHGFNDYSFYFEGAAVNLFEVHDLGVVVESDTPRVNQTDDSIETQVEQGLQSARPEDPL